MKRITFILFTLTVLVQWYYIAKLHHQREFAIKGWAEASKDKPINSGVTNYGLSIWNYSDKPVTITIPPNAATNLVFKQ